MKHIENRMGCGLSRAGKEKGKEKDKGEHRGKGKGGKGLGDKMRRGGAGVSVLLLG